MFKWLFNRLSVFFYYRTSVFARYLSKQVFVTFLAIVVILMLVLMGNQFLNFLTKAQAMGLSSQMLLPLVSLKVLRDFVPLFPLALFLAIIFAIGRLYKDSEAVVLNASGIDEKNIIVLIQPVVIAVFLLVAWLSFFVSPWSKEKSEQLLAQIDKSNYLATIEAGEFNVFHDLNLTFYVSEISPDRQTMLGVFAQLKLNNEPILIVAKNAKQFIDEKNQDVRLLFNNGTRYQGFDKRYDQLDKKEQNNMMAFEHYTIRTHRGRLQNSAQDSTTKALPSQTLFLSDNAKYSAEWHWRLAQPLSVLLLSILAVFLAKSSPRQGRGRGLFVGIFVFVLYNNLLVLAKTWLGDGVLNHYMGFWWVHILLLIVIAIFYDCRHQFYLARFTKLFGLRLK